MDEARVRSTVRALRCEGGFTLVELTISMSMLIAVLAIATPLITTAMRSEPELRERSANVQEARIVLDRLTREIREGVSAVTAGALHLVSPTAPTPASRPVAAPRSSPERAPTLCRVTYQCVGGLCRRTEAREDGASPASPAWSSIRGLQTNNIFAYTPAPRRLRRGHPRPARPRRHGQPDDRGRRHPPQRTLSN